MRMLSTWRKRGVSRRELLKLIRNLLDLQLQLFDSLNEHHREGFDCGCHLRFDLWRDDNSIIWWLSGRRHIGAEIAAPSPDQFTIPCNGQ
jgi:hypothetical protein